MRYLILGTAGHVDHGKTALVKALTGVDTDRLPEERKRGLTIELGFAPLVLDRNLTLGIVDVPGHERFIKTMVAGAAGVDLAMLLVAADEGVKPQTREHLDVCRLLGVPRGVVVLSKCDLADAELIDLVEEEVVELCKETFLEGAPRVRTSASRGEGLDELKEALLRQARAVSDRSGGKTFRMPVDRVFSRTGIGTIVTGTPWSGRVVRGDSLETLPGGRRVRVREVQTFDRRVEEAGRGQRTALALHGVKPGEIARGHQLLTPGLLSASHLLDLRLFLLPDEERSLRNRERVRVHHGTREVLGRVVLLERDEMRPGETAFAQLRLESALIADRGDPCVLRRYSPARVIAGGRVVDPRPGKHRRHRPEVLETLRVEAGGTESDRLRSALRRAGPRGLSRAELKEAPGDVSGLVEGGEVHVIAGRHVLGVLVQELAGRLRDEVERFHERHPLRWGPEREELRSRLGYEGSAAEFSALLDHLAATGMVELRDSAVRVRGRSREPDPEQRAALSRLEELHRRSGFASPDEGAVRSVLPEREEPEPYLAYLRERGILVRIGDRLHLHRETMNSLIREIESLLESSEEVDVGKVKERLGLSRKYVVPLLEYLDERGVTRRRGDVRVRGPRYGLEGPREGR
jgi:selenocysteine-specific elongation factor